MNKKKIVIIFTGGTIAMKMDPRIHAAIPALTSEDIISMLTNIEDLAELEVINYSNIPSPHISPDMMMEISSLISETLARPDIDAVILTHGTDSLEETAYLLDLVLDSEKPVIVVGAMRNSSELGYDGSSNLSAALCVAISSRSKNMGVLVVMNNEVNSASEVTKTNTLSLDTFKSPELGPLGIVDNDQFIIYRNALPRQNISTNVIENKVALIKTVSGIESDIIDFYIDNGYKGFVIEAMGRGNVPPLLVPGIKRALDKNLPVVLVSRCPTGRVLDTYGYEGAGKNLRQMGVIFGGSLPGQKIRIKLMLVLGKTNNMDEIKALLEDSFLLENVDCR